MSLKCCMPKGIPIIVMHRSRPKPRWVRAMGMPPKNHHMMFMIPARHPDGHPLLEIAVPKGHKATVASFIVWQPKGMPIIVSIKSRLETAYSMAIARPPNIIQIIFRKMFIEV